MRDECSRCVIDYVINGNKFMPYAPACYGSYKSQYILRSAVNNNMEQAIATTTSGR